MSKANNDIQICRNCEYYRYAVCVVHKRRIEENACCSHWEFDSEEKSDSDLRISVAKLREVLEKLADGNGFLVEDVDTIIEKVKSEI